MDIETKINQVLAKLNLSQKVALLHGSDDIRFGGIPELDIPEVLTADGPQGIRLEDGTKTTALPCGIGLAATWNPATAQEYGAVIAEDAIANDIQVSLGPAFNLMRTPLNGRNFEYYGEDPVLAGKIASGYVLGCQAKGVAATPKHLALNNQEICRTTGNSICDKKTLRELYLEAFEIVIREAHPWMMMSSYNRINGSYASECKYTQQDVCKDECGFDGVMVSDWGGTHAAMEALRGGLDLEMGGSIANWMNFPLMEQLMSNKITEKELDDHVRRVLRLIFRVTSTRPQAIAKGAKKAHGKIARKISCESAVLLKNDNLLPLNTDSLKRILVCGPSADFRHCTDLIHGGGSGAVHPEHETTAWEAIQKRLGDKCRVEYIPGVSFRDTQAFPDELVKSCTSEFYDTFEAMEEGRKPFYTEKNKTLQLHWGVILVGGINNPGAVLGNRTYAMKVQAQVVATKNETWKIGLMLTRTAQTSLTVDGKCLLDDKACQLLDNSAELKVKAGQTYTFEIRGFHNVAAEDCDCKLLLYYDAKQSREQALKAAAKADAVIYVGGSNHLYDREAIGWGDVEGADVPELELPDEQTSFLTALAKENSNVVVALMGGTVMNVEPWIESVKSVVDFWYPGQECGDVIVDILTGKASPEGHLPFTWGKRLNDYACHANGNYPGVRKGTDPHVRYDEGIFIGYRHFDRAKIAPRFPFGFGLNYTSFVYSVTKKPKVTGKVADKSLKVILHGTVKNTGKRAGQALVQLYVSQPSCKHETRPLKVLRNFTKVALKAGDEQAFSLQLTWRDFAFFSPEVDGFIAEAGPCQLLVLDGQSQLVASLPVSLK